MIHCQVGQGYDPNRIVCQGGDRGGPVFQRTSTNAVAAVGIIAADGDGGHECWYTLITAIESTTNTHIDTNPYG